MFKLSAKIGISIVVMLLGFSAPNYAKVKTPPANELPLNTINGQVWAPNNRPVPNIYVELLNEVNSTLDRQRTSQAGQFTFTGISSGRFKLRVLALGTDYLEATMDVQIMNLVQGMSDNQYVDIRMRYDPKRVKLGSGGPAEEVFVQEGITKDAEKRYNKGLDLLMDKKSAQAIAEFKAAIEIFPNYYYALNAMGKELVEQKKYQDALEPLIRAIDLNQRSYTSYYALGYACYQLNQIPQAVEAAKAATILKPASLDAQLLYGTVSRISGSYDAAEKILLKAKTLGDNKFAPVNWQLALVYNRLKRNKEAADELDSYLKNQPNAANKKDVQELIGKLRGNGEVKIQ